MSKHLVGMVIASPGVHTDLEVNPKPNLDTEQGLSRTVTHEVDLEVPPHLTGKKCSLFSFTPKENLLSAQKNISIRGVITVFT